MKRWLAVVLALCLVLGLGVTAFAAEEQVLSLNAPVTVTAEPAADELVDEYLYFTFTPEESGCYAFCAEAAESEENEDLWQSISVSADCSYGEALSLNAVLFEAEAGQSYELCVNYWGSFPVAVEYTLWVEKCAVVTEIFVDSYVDYGVVGDYLSLQASYEPELYEVQSLTWEVSDPQIAAIVDAYGDNVELELLSAGQTTVSVTTADGLSASLDIIVYEALETVVLVEEEANPVSLNPYVETPVSFTPAESGYYLLSSDSDVAYCMLNADGFLSDEGYVYYLEAEQTYDGWASCYDEEVDCNLYIAKTEALSLEAMELVSEPENKEFLLGSVESLDGSQVLPGAQLKLTWSDGSETLWDYNVDGEYLGQYLYISRGITDNGDGTGAVELFCGEIGVSWDINLLDLSVTDFALVGEPVVQVVENSCGIDLSVLAEQLGVPGISGWYYLPFVGYTRQVSITFSDGSVVTVCPGEIVYGEQVYCTDSIDVYGLWEQGEENTLIYGYQDETIEVAVELIESPVERIELNSVPRNVYALEDETVFSGNAEDGWFFEPADIQTILEGLSMTVYYKDGTSETITDEDLVYIDVGGMGYPFYNGYPLGIFSKMLLSFEGITGPCELEGVVEYKGVSVTYPVQVVEEIPEEEPPQEPETPDDGKDDVVIEPNPETDDTGAAILLTLLAACTLIAAAVVLEKNKLT
ncbi:MAG: Ig-like domain-containing protein [Oscillospiraceae bacterium]|nr:Ig-like domain-containing protein [Oscillospiraceae bacterium]